jgi:CBS domain containing-hemolysin-like protein
VVKLLLATLCLAPYGALRKVFADRAEYEALKRRLAAARSPADLVLLIEESARTGSIAAEQQEILSRALDLPDAPS